MNARSQLFAISFIMKQFDLFDKPMNGLYSRTSRGGVCRVFVMCVTDSVLFGTVHCSDRVSLFCSNLSVDRE